MIPDPGGLLPEKKTPQEWTDVVLPLFDQPVEVIKERSKKQQDDDRKVTYRPYRSVRTACQDCLEFGSMGGGILNATYVRVHGDEKRYLCSRHRAQRSDNDQLGKS